MKRYEIMLEKKRKEEKRKEDHREQVEMDELTVLTYKPPVDSHTS
jgi:flagellar biosynthesis chaperone FliJ